MAHKVTPPSVRPSPTRCRLSMFNRMARRGLVGSISLMHLAAAVLRTHTSSSPALHHAPLHARGAWRHGGRSVLLARARLARVGLHRRGERDPSRRRLGRARRKTGSTRAPGKRPPRPPRRRPRGVDAREVARRRAMNSRSFAVRCGRSSVVQTPRGVAASPTGKRTRTPDDATSRRRGIPYARARKQSGRVVFSRCARRRS